VTTNNLSSSSSGGIGFVGVLTIVFIVLKLTHVIAWSWWWVLSPLWIGALLSLAGLLLVLLVAGIAVLVGRRATK
jgi:hypothetical protein